MLGAQMRHQKILCEHRSCHARRDAQIVHSGSSNHRAFKRGDRQFSSTALGVGLPLGNLTSQLLVNMYMNEFDQFVKHTLKAKYYLRYADDFVILPATESGWKSSCRRYVIFSRIG